jgi:hypothetical protein
VRGRTAGAAQARRSDRMPAPSGSVPRPSAAALSGARPPLTPPYAVIRMYTLESFSGSWVMLWMRTWLRSP